MGVRMLQTYCKLIGALRWVNFNDEVQRYRTETGKSPVVLFDGINLMVSIIIHEDLTFVDCRLLNFAEHTRNIIKRFKDLGVSLTIYLDGSDWKKNPNAYVMKRQQRTANVRKAFDMINNCCPVKNVERFVGHILLSNAWNVFVHILKAEGCEVKHSMQDCDVELIDYASTKPCMAIFANDSDFIINAPCNVYLTKSMKLESMTFLKVDRTKVSSSLDLDIKDFPLFATIVGNDFIPKHYLYMEVNGIDNYNDRIDIKRWFQGVAKYIKTLQVETNISDTTFKRISWDLFNSDCAVDLLKKSIAFYEGKQKVYPKQLISCEDKNWNAIIKEAYSHCNNSYTARMFSVIVHFIYQKCEQFEDFRENDLPPVSLVTKSLRQKIYGILLYERPGIPQPVEEMIVTNDNIFEPNLVEIVFPEVHHPGLLALWGKEDLDLDKWILLAEAFDVCYKRIQMLPRNLLVPALTLKYLMRTVELEEWEILAVILSATVLNFVEREILFGITVTYVQSRALRVISLITTAYSDVTFILDALGGPISRNEYLPSNYHYGVLFHIIYKTLRFGLTPSFIIDKGLCLKDNITCKNMFEKIVDFIFEDDTNRN